MIEITTNIEDLSDKTNEDKPHTIIYYDMNSERVINLEDDKRRTVKYV